MLHMRSESSLVRVSGEEGVAISLSTAGGVCIGNGFGVKVSCPCVSEFCGAADTCGSRLSLTCAKSFWITSVVRVDNYCHTILAT